MDLSDEHDSAPSYLGMVADQFDQKGRTVHLARAAYVGSGDAIDG
jgi:hypothetical protein